MEGGRKDTCGAIRNMAALTMAVQGEDSLYRWGSPRRGGTRGILVLSQLTGISRDRSCIGVLIGLNNPIAGHSVFQNRTGGCPLGPFLYI